MQRLPYPLKDLSPVRLTRQLQREVSVRNGYALPGRWLIARM
jgi:hypothetical protein